MPTAPKQLAAGLLIAHIPTHTYSHASEQVCANVYSYLCNTCIHTNADPGCVCLCGCVKKILLLVCCEIPNLFYLISVLLSLVFLLCCFFLHIFLFMQNTYIYAINATPTHLPPLSCLWAAFIWISCHMSHAVSCYSHRSTAPRFLFPFHLRSPLAPSDIVFVVIVIVVNVASDNITFAYFCANTRRPRQCAQCHPGPPPYFHTPTSPFPSAVGVCAFLLNFICIGFALMSPWSPLLGAAVAFWNFAISTINFNSIYC